jgi:transposase
MNTSDLTITTERIDDFVLLIELMKQIDLPNLLDRHLPHHWLQEGLSWGWVTTIWLAHILSQGDHRKLTVRDWVRQAHSTLEHVTGRSIRDTDFTDDRLTIVLRLLSKADSWSAIEQELGQTLIRVYDLAKAPVRLDATTISGYHAGGPTSLFQFGESKDAPDLRQVKVMMGALDPLGLPLATDVVAGERADDGLYVPIIERIVTTLATVGLLFVGDSKMSAWATRVHLRAWQQHYLAPLALVGETPRALRGWIQAARSGEQPLTEILAPAAEDDDAPLAVGYAVSRPCTAVVEGQALAWTERVLVVHSAAYAEMQQRGLEGRLARATSKLQALTPPRGRGKRQIQDEVALTVAAEAILQAHKVQGLLTYSYERQVERTVKYVGRGRGGTERPQQVVERVRYALTGVTRAEAAISALCDTFGWRAYVTDVAEEELSLEAAVLSYRAEWRIERDYHRLKSAPLSIAPLFVKRDDQVKGLVHLLSIAIRLLTLIEFVVRRGLERAQATLVGLHPENPKKATATPTTERLLKAFDHITVTVLHFPDHVLHHVTPLTSLQLDILALLDLSPDIYRSLAKNSP